MTFPLAEIRVNDFGGSPFAEHNMPCPICRQNHAVMYLNTGVFWPCGECENERGWYTIRVPRRLRGLLGWILDRWSRRAR